MTDVDARREMPRLERSAAQRRVHGAALGYQPFRMKPVHFANSFLLNLTRTHHELRWLNLASVPKATALVDGDPYVAETLLPMLRQDGRVSNTVDVAGFRTLRAHLNAAFNNDGAALGARFNPYSTFGSDYSSPSTHYVTNQSKNHGHSGSFVYRVMLETEDGRAFLATCREIVSASAPPSASLAGPLLDAEGVEWEDDYEKLFGPAAAGRIDAAAGIMSPQTAALRRLAENLRESSPSHSLRFLVIGLCSWLFLYGMRRPPLQAEPVLLMDFLRGSNGRVRSQSRAAYARQMDLFVRSYDRWERVNAGIVDEADWRAFTEDGRQPRELEGHFRDLGLRVGFVQPRAAQARRKHFELQADTLRVLAISLMTGEELISLTEFAERLLRVWNVCTGAHPGDEALLRSRGFGPLDPDEDLEENGRGFRELLVRLGLAVEPSDGLALCGLRPQDLI